MVIGLKSKLCRSEPPYSPAMLAVDILLDWRVQVPLPVLLLELTNGTYVV